MTIDDIKLRRVYRPKPGASKSRQKRFPSRFVDSHYLIMYRVKDDGTSDTTRRVRMNWRVFLREFELDV